MLREISFHEINLEMILPAVVYVNCYIFLLENE